MTIARKGEPAGMTTRARAKRRIAETRKSAGAPLSKASSSPKKLAKRSGRKKTDEEHQEDVKQAVLEAKVVGNWTVADPPIIALGCSGVVFRVFKAPFSNDLFAMKAEVDMPTCRIGYEANLLRRLNSINCRTQRPLSM